MKAYLTKCLTEEASPYLLSNLRDQVQESDKGEWKIVPSQSHHMQGGCTKKEAINSNRGSSWQCNVVINTSSAVYSYWKCWRNISFLMPSSTIQHTFLYPMKKENSGRRSCQPTMMFLLTCVGSLPLLVIYDVSDKRRRKPIRLEGGSLSRA